jgi:hypothetical protein
MNLDERRACFIYEAARLHAKFLECPVIPTEWEKRENDFKKQFIELIKDLCSGRRKFKDPQEAHASWVQKYLEMGWKYGEEYDPKRKTHPDLVEYDELDPKEKIKDMVFLSLVEIAKNYIW